MSHGPAWRRHAGRHASGVVAAAVTGVLAVSGATCVGLAASRQRHAPEPPLISRQSTSRSTVAAGAPVPENAGPATSAPAAPDPVPAVPAGPAQPPVPAPVAAAATRPPAVVGPVLPASEPLSLAIPAIGVHSELLHLGQTATGALQVPAPGPDYDLAGWYEYSPTPGSLGPAVIAGHVDSAGHGPSVFFRLGDLRPGERVLVTRADGSVAAFAVDDVRRYHKAEFPSQLVYGDTDHAALRLISCGGPFDRRSGHYVDNIVVLGSLQAG